MPKAADDAEVIADVLSGRDDRFEIIVDRYYGALLRVAESRLGRRDWAEDVIQESLLAAFRSLHTYDSRYSFRTWLWTIVLNQCRRRFKRTRSLNTVDIQTAVDELEDQRNESPPEVAMRDETQRQLNQMLCDLPVYQGDALRLRFFAGLKFQEIADTMGCSLSSAKNRVRVGLTKLSETLIYNGDCELGE